MDPNLLGAALGDLTSWTTWRTALRAAFGLPLDEEQRRIFAVIAGGRSPPATRVKELWAVVGRRGGKSRTAAAIAVHTALLQQHRLAPGETGYVLVLSQTVLQAKLVFDYARAFIDQSPVLRQELIDATRSEIRLANGVIIATHPSSFRSIRGRTLLAVVFDESAVWRDETSANPDLEVYRAAKPALIASGGQLIGISSPYRKIGLLYNRHKDYFGRDDPNVLVVQGRSRLFNPLLDEAEITEALADDPEGSLSEWEAEFRSDIAAFLSDVDIDACVDRDRPIELPPRRSVAYHAFVDPSGGLHDHFTMAVGHRDGDRTVVDVLRGQPPPFDPKLVVGEYTALLAEYGIRQVTGDNYAAAWVETEFRAAGIRYLRSELPKGRLYVEGLPAFTRRAIALPDHPRLLRELRLLERRSHAGGKDSVDHGRVGSDDYANAVFGVLHAAQRPNQRLRMFTLAAPYGGRTPSIEIDPSTGRPIEHARSRVRWVNVRESDVPPVMGP
ncbi:terminase [Bradyrhizobium yuanmingense]|uniref:terminase n=1 Tax=Bradyrhizobium yuanmingense TaxID=108015 RepID=UPI001CD60E6A|nr:terminase [Bradyrhizobium yuanmingense]MCA1530710.1 terminase [Bradyrhizobium yuanmingense]